MGWAEPADVSVQCHCATHGFRRAELFLVCIVVCCAEGDGLEMSDTYIIEVGSQAAGIVVRDREGYRFFAASHRFNPIEGQVFRNAREAERAALRLASGGLLVA
jgi:hypothetical protein